MGGRPKKTPRQSNTILEVLGLLLSEPVETHTAVRNLHYTAIQSLVMRMHMYTSSYVCAYAYHIYTHDCLCGWVYIKKVGI